MAIEWYDYKWSEWKFRASKKSIIIDDWLMKNKNKQDTIKKIYPTHQDDKCLVRIWH